MSLLHNGTILKNKYQIYSILQEGWVSQTYLGKEILTGKEIVIKVLRSIYGDYREDSVRSNKIILEAIKLEAKTLKSIQHPNIVKYIDDDIDANNGYYFLVLEYIKGASLKEIYNGNACPEHDLNNICITLLNVVTNLHNINILHRDICPDDIIISNKGELKIIDMGIVKKALEQTDDTSRLYHKEYSAPEQLYRISIYQSNIFSVGATMWFLVTGQSPMRDTNGRILSAKNLNRSVSEHIDSIILKATDPDVTSRYQTADEMIQALMVSSQ